MNQKKFTFKTVLLEIFIVIVGISIAFWVNSWGEERKERALEMEFLRTLRSELATDSVAFASQINNNQEVIDNLYRFVEICRTQDYDNDSIPWFVGNFLNRFNWILNTNTYEMLKSGGNLDIISDFELRNDISSFYKVRGFQTAKMLDVMQDFTDYQMNPYLTKHTNYFISNNPDRDFVKDTEFQNLLALWASYTESKLDIYEGTLEEITLLMTDFDEHLSK